MPLYTFTCRGCEAPNVTLFRKIAERDDLAQCERCEHPLERILDAPRVAPDYAGYDCPITGKWIEGRKAHQENLAKHGCRVYEAGETQAAKRNAAKAEEALLERIADSAAQQVMAMPTEKRAALAQVLESHDVAYSRN